MSAEFSSAGSGAGSGASWVDLSRVISSRVTSADAGAGVVISVTVEMLLDPESEVEPFGLIEVAPAIPVAGIVIIAAAVIPSAYLENICLAIGNKTYLYFDSLCISDHRYTKNTPRNSVCLSL